MILLKVKASKNPSQLWLIFDNQSILPFSVDDWVKQRLAPPVEISSDQLEILNQLSLIYLLKNYSLRQIGLSPKIAADLIPKLKLKIRLFLHKYHIKEVNQDEIITFVIDYLEQNHLLEQSDYVNFVLNKFRSKSKNYIVSYLRHKNIDVRQFPQLQTQEDIPRIKSIISLPKNQRLLQSDRRSRLKLIASLVRKGFAYNDVKSLIDIGPDY